MLLIRTMLAFLEDPSAASNFGMPVNQKEHGTKEEILDRGETFVLAKPRPLSSMIAP